jgi:hypothetical protein
LRYNSDKMKIYIPGVSRERARELVLQHINQDPSLVSLRVNSMTWILLNLS